LPTAVSIRIKAFVAIDLTYMVNYTPFPLIGQRAPATVS